MEPDLTKIREIGLTLAQTVKGFNRREFLKELSLGREPRIKVLVGFRGLGKTTALLQLLTDEKTVYLSFDHPYIAGYSLYELGKSFIRAGYKTLLIDEVHHYKEWKRDSKALYDEFPEASLVLSGSAPLAFEPERRYEIINVEQLSLKEFIEIQGRKIGVSESWRNSEQSVSFLALNSWIYEFFERYSGGGGFPINLTYKEKTFEAVYNSIKKSIREDAPFFALVRGEEIVAMEKLLIMLATSNLGEFSINSLARQLEIKKHVGYKLVSLLEKMRILRIIRPYGRGPKLVRGEPKLMFFHPNLRAAVCQALNINAEIGALREELAVFSFLKRGWNVYTIKGKKKQPDYLIEKGKEKFVVEVGGSSKTSRQLKGFKEQGLVLKERQLIILALS